MAIHANPQSAVVKPTKAALSRGLLQRTCACSGSSGLTGECSECQNKKLLGEPLQTKLRISQPGDEYEQEADRVAEQVMRMADPKLDSERSPLVQRKAAERDTLVTEAPAPVHQVLSVSGQPLDAATRAFFEPRFGHDFGKVRVHSGAPAAQSAAELNAKAFTVGCNIVFGAGQFAPETQDGRRLLAHELTHVIHQRTGNLSGQTIQRAKIPYGPLSWADFKASPPNDQNPAEGAGILSAFDIPGFAVSPDTKKTRKNCKIGSSVSTTYEATLAIDAKAFDSLESYMDQARSWALDRYKGDGSGYCDSKVGKNNTKLFNQCLTDETIERARLLKHEQVHFDITNVMAGKAKASLTAEAAKVKLTASGCGQEAASDAVLALYERPRNDLSDLAKNWLASKTQAQDDFDTQTGHGAKIAVQNAWEGKIKTGLKEYTPSTLPPPSAETTPSKKAPEPEPAKPSAPSSRGFSKVVKNNSRLESFYPGLVRVRVQR